MWLIMQQPKPEDFVIATGEYHTVRQFCTLAFKELGISLRWEGEGVDEKGIDESTGKVLVEVDPKYFRPSEVEQLLGDQRGKAKLAFVGDGINDAPVLSRADIGIAMGAMGSDAAIEAADIVLMDDEPMQIAKAIKISRKCIGIVYQNIVFALVVKFACLALVAVGAADMWAAIFADVGVMVLAVLNAIRALRYKE